MHSGRWRREKKAPKPTQSLSFLFCAMFARIRARTGLCSITDNCLEILRNWLTVINYCKCREKFRTFHFFLCNVFFFSLALEHASNLDYVTWKFLNFLAVIKRLVELLSVSFLFVPCLGPLERALIFVASLIIAWKFLQIYSLP